MRSLRIILALLVGLVTLGNVPGTFNAINNNGLYVLSYTVVGSGGGGGTAYDPGSLGYAVGGGGGGTVLNGTLNIVPGAGSFTVTVAAATAAGASGTASSVIVPGASTITAPGGGAGAFGSTGGSAGGNGGGASGSTAGGTGSPCNNGATGSNSSGAAGGGSYNYGAYGGGTGYAGIVIFWHSGSSRMKCTGCTVAAYSTGTSYTFTGSGTLSP